MPTSEVYGAARCRCEHLFTQHFNEGTHPSSRPGCWWCDCPEFAPHDEQGTFGEVVAQRDVARRWAVTLEQENAQLTEQSAARVAS